MKSIFSLVIMLTSFMLYSQIPFTQMPSFETSAQGHVATGLGIADINNDGWKDIIVANGNDIHRQKLVVYYNNGDGTFPDMPSWQSADIDFHGHLSAGDIDNDGDVDIAVSVYLGPAGFGHPGKAKIYFNSGSELETTPSFQTENFYSFSCTLGDADADGDLDLAVACSEPYGSIWDYGRIFYNNDGSFDTIADWHSTVLMGSMDVEFGDVDQNGFLDLIFVSEELDNYVFLADDHGNIDEDFDWVSDHPSNYMNSVDFGRPCATSAPCIVMTGNDQLGGDGKIKQFVFSHPIPGSSTPSWESAYVGYGSGILMAEITNDGNLDLLYGSWWGPLGILEGDCGFWTTTPAYISDETSVVEAILMSDLGKFNYQADSKTIKALQEESIIYLNQQIIEKINAVYVNGTLLDRTEYCYAELKNWVSFKENIMPGNVVTIEYEYMKDGDIVISNWDSNKGNFIYYNTHNPVGLMESSNPSADFLITGLSPQPASDHLQITFKSEDNRFIEFSIYDISGKTMYSGTSHGGDRIDINVSDLPNGLYTIMLSNGLQYDRHKILIAR